jgi:hypothetical protein
VEQIKSVVRAYAVKRRLDPDRLEGLLSEALESDEASGPEDDSGESQETWKARMAAIAGISVSSRSTYEGLQFVEVLDPDWRSKEVSHSFPLNSSSINVYLVLRISTPSA